MPKRTVAEQLAESGVEFRHSYIGREVTRTRSGTEDLQYKFQVTLSRSVEGEQRTMTFDYRVGASECQAMTAKPPTVDAQFSAMGYALLAAKRVLDASTPDDWYKAAGWGHLAANEREAAGAVVKYEREQQLTQQLVDLVGRETLETWVNETAEI